MMNINTPLDLLAKMSPSDFMRDYWQKKPLLVRGAIASEVLDTLPSKSALLELATREGVSSRFVQLKNTTWALKHGPFAMRQLPSLKIPNWSLLVQGVDLVNAATYALLQQFRFVPDARLDDAMFSFATAGGGVGPHFDSYDVFLIQTSGARRWRIGAQKNLTLIEGAPLKILANFKPSKEYVLEAGDMLYLPPRYAHDGVAIDSKDSKLPGGDCITCSIGFRAPKKVELARELMDRLSEDLSDRIDESLLYADKAQSATATPAKIPMELVTFAREALIKALGNDLDLQIHLGEYLTEPKPEVWFESTNRNDSKIAWSKVKALKLDAATRMMFDAKHIFINGESFAASGADAKLMQKFANIRLLERSDLREASADAKALIAEWVQSGWCHGE